MTNLTPNLTGYFYPKFTADTTRYTPADNSCAEHVLTRLLEASTSAERPGMLLGKIQSGKTKAFLTIIALAFDNDFDIAIILTKGTKALARQTLARVRREFAPFYSEDRLQMFDIMAIPDGLTGYELSQKLIFVVKKQSDNLDRMVEVFRNTYPQLANKRVLIVDDEADYASIGFRNTKLQGTVVNTTTQQIDDLRDTLPHSAFLQVTATPYSLYLQPSDTIVNGTEFKPIRPAFTELVPVHQNYIGSDYYFDLALDQANIASFLYRPVTRIELEVLRKEDKRRFRIEECLTHPAIATLREAVVSFIVGGCIRRMQDEHANLPPKKFSFLVHTEAGREAHAWQERVVTRLDVELREAVHKNPDVLRALIQASYDDLAGSIHLNQLDLPSLDEVILQVFTTLEHGWLMTTKVNSEKQVEDLLDDEGQLRLRTPLNIFIGGQILDRGITIANLIGFFYGRRPQIYQQDTVLQHSRMFGFRPLTDLAVTRFYTEPQIYDAMRRMHESDVALRSSIEQNPNQAVTFIQKDDHGRIIPCSPNKILLSNTTTLRPFKRILPVGFQTDYATRVRPIVNEIDVLLDNLRGTNPLNEPFKIPLTAALDILARIEPTICMEEEEGYKFDWLAAHAALAYLSQLSLLPENNAQVWCLIRQNRNLSRLKALGSHSTYADAPDTRRDEGSIVQAVAIDTPLLLLSRQTGLATQGWRDTPFYWPVIFAQRNTRTAIFSHEATNESIF